MDSLYTSLWTGPESGSVSVRVFFSALSKPLPRWLRVLVCFSSLLLKAKRSVWVSLSFWKPRGRLEHNPDRCNLLLVWKHSFQIQPEMGLREQLWIVFRTVIWWTSPISFEGSDRREWDFKSGKLASGPAQISLPTSSLQPAENKSSRVGKWHSATSRQLPGHWGLWLKAGLPSFRVCPKAWGGKTCHSARRRREQGAVRARWVLSSLSALIVYSCVTHTHCQCESE